MFCCRFLFSPQHDYIHAILLNWTSAIQAHPVIIIQVFYYCYDYYYYIFFFFFCIAELLTLQNSFYCKVLNT